MTTIGQIPYFSETTSNNGTSIIVNSDNNSPSIYTGYFSSEPDVPTTEPVEDPPTTKQYYMDENTKKEVLDILKNYSDEIDIKSLDILKVNEKYVNIKNYELQNNIYPSQAEQRIVNYAKGLLFERQGDAFVEDLASGKEPKGEINLPKVAAAVEAGSIEQMIAGYQQHAREYIEIFDDEKGDHEISFEEWCKNEGDQLTSEEKEYLKYVFDKLNQGGGETLNQREIAAYLYACANGTHVKGESLSNKEITANEYLRALQATSPTSDLDNYLTEALGADGVDKLSIKLANWYKNNKGKVGYPTATELGYTNESEKLIVNEWIRTNYENTLFEHYLESGYANLG